jgi:hypothetical protein
MLVKTIFATTYTEKTSTTASLNTTTDAFAAATKDIPLKTVSVTTSIKHSSRVNAPPLTTLEQARIISTVSSVVNTVSLSIAALPTTPLTLIPESTYNASTIPNLNQLNGHADMKVPTSELTPVYATLDIAQVILTVSALHATTWMNVPMVTQLLDQSTAVEEPALTLMVATLVNATVDTD